MIVSIVIWLLSLLGFGLIYIYNPSAITLVFSMLLIVVPVMSIISSIIASKFVEVIFDVPEVISKRETKQILIKVISKTPLPLSKVKATISLENYLTGESSIKKLDLPVKAHGEKVSYYNFEGTVCGFIECKVIEIRAVDFFNLSSIKTKAGEKDEMIIVPDTFDIRLNLPENISANDENDQYSPDKPGNDYSEVFQVREYSEGDSPKQIHWKLTSKFDRLISRDPGLPTEKSIFVFWERSAPNGREETETSDMMIEVLVSLVRGILEQGISCRLAWNEEGDVCSDIVLFNEDDLYAILPRLLKAKATGEGSGAEIFNRLNLSQVRGNIIYLSSYEAFGLEELGRGNRLIKLIEGDAFKKETYAEDLREISFY